MSVCHCLACQRRTGGVFASQARFARQDVEIDGTGTEFVRIGDEGGKATFTFCPACGDTLWWVNESAEDSLAIPVGAFAEPGFPPPTVSVYEERMHSWVTMPDGIEHLF